MCYINPRFTYLLTYLLNHSLQFWLQYFQEFRIYRDSKFPFSHWLCWSSLQQCWRAACGVCMYELVFIGIVIQWSCWPLISCIWLCLTGHCRCQGKVFALPVCTWHGLTHSVETCHQCCFYAAIRKTSWLTTRESSIRVFCPQLPLCLQRRKLFLLQLLWCDTLVLEEWANESDDWKTPFCHKVSTPQAGKKGDTILMSMSSPNIDGFYKFFHWHTL